ncbi:hypothetical protein Pint_29737 [Pistacia integerrima]|uniref:Uncharacterized protein n=1 Tax=Pistacia integerrima TaxID=434235 RepID=A0ACC0X2J7_9ROSI|nr:hypothetical protein Pint_29737 [Pistacia integerrima]
MCSFVACSALSAVEEGRKIHEDAIRTNWETDVFVGAALIDMYAKCSCVESAREVFDKILVRDVVLWNSMIATYAQNGKPDESLDYNLTSSQKMIAENGKRKSVGERI